MSPENGASGTAGAAGPQDGSGRPPRIGRGRAHAKIILFGEHAVVHGQPAIAFPMRQIGLDATARPVEGDLRLTVDIYDGPLAQAPSKLSPLVTTIEAALDLLHQPLRDVHIWCDGDIPLERGLGSSAAGAAAIINAIDDLFEGHLDEYSRYELVQAGERIAHGSPSGLDAYTVVGAKPIWFQAGSIEPLTVNLQTPLVIADSGHAGDTHSAVAAVSEIRRADPKLAAEYFDRIRHHTVAARRDLAQDDRESLGRRMNEVQQTLHAMSVSSPKLDRLIETARDAGALGAKLTGGGRGGCIIALPATPEDALPLSQALRRAGAPRTWIVAPEEYHQ